MKKSKPAIEIKNLSKKFVLPKYNRNSIKEVIVNGLFKNEKTEHQVLDNVSLTINEGDFFGIVGRNGSGKSTLLKLIAGVYAPDAGEIKLHGKLTPFIELGVGFNHELSGRDNVFLNGALLGFTRKQMEAMYDEIVEFAELEEFMDLKLKNYSSGMQVRLAFSIAIKAKNDILIFDEVLAVGDEAFQRKSLDEFEKYKAEKQTIVLVTHSMETVKKFCNRAALIDKGDVVKVGDPIEVAHAYSSLNQIQINKSVQSKVTFRDDVQIKIFGGPNSRQTKASFEVGEPIRVRIKWPKKLPVHSIMVDLMRKSGGIVTNFMTDRPNKEGQCFGIKSNEIELTINPILGPGRYSFCFNFYDEKRNRIFLDFAEIDFIINPNWESVGYRWAGDTYFTHKWKEIR